MTWLNHRLLPCSMVCIRHSWDVSSTCFLERQRTSRLDRQPSCRCWLLNSAPSSKMTLLMLSCWRSSVASSRSSWEFSILVRIAKIQSTYLIQVKAYIFIDWKLTCIYTMSHCSMVDLLVLPGFLVDYISHPVINSFTTAAAITIACSQVKVSCTMSWLRVIYPIDGRGFNSLQGKQTKTDRVLGWILEFSLLISPIASMHFLWHRNTAPRQPWHESVVSASKTAPTYKSPPLELTQSLVVSSDWIPRIQDVQSYALQLL